MTLQEEVKKLYDDYMENKNKKPCKECKFCKRNYIDMFEPCKEEGDLI